MKNPALHPNSIDLAARSVRKSTFALPAGVTRRLIGLLVLVSVFATSAPAQELNPVITIRGDGKTVATFSEVGTGTWTIPAGVSSVEVLVVGGGGAGARGGAFGGPSGGSPGGGAGGLYFTNNYSVTGGGAVNIAVGGGAAVTTAVGSGLSGNQSLFDQIIGYGGAGGNYNTNAGGNQGGYSTDGGANSTPGFEGGIGNGATGGGGAGEDGRDGGFSPAYGGAGVSSSIAGSSVGYGGGGSAGYDGVGLGHGALFGGGEGSFPEGTAGTSGVNGKGGGGGGGRSANGGGGGSGTVIVVYEDASVVTYTVSYESNGGSTVAGEVVPQNLTATEPSAPTLAGFTFGGWHSDETLTLSYDFNSPVTQNITLYASWTIHSYTLIYTPGINGTLIGDSPQTVEHGSSGSEVTAIPDEGYLFLKWSDESVSNPRTDSNVSGDITVTAQFIAIPPPFTPDTVVSRGDGKTVAIFSSIGSGTWTIPDGVTSLEVLVVGGGGGGGGTTVSGGGGSGGVYFNAAVPVISGGYVVTVGAGGAIGGTGVDSAFDDIIAFGGKPGQANNGSGGASGGYSTDGGATEGIFAGGGPNFWIGGGGGAGQAGFAGLGDHGAPIYNSGGNGLEYDITGTPTYYGGGGGNTYVGGYRGNEDPPIYNGGLGGGGAGDATSDGGGPATVGANGLGGGGGGGRNFGGAAGGSGVVIIAYQDPNGTATATELDSSLNPSNDGDSVSFTATIKDGGVTATSATGSVEFKVDDVVVEAAAPITDGVATYTTSALALGGRAIMATYSGDETYSGSSGNLTQTVNASPYNQWAGPAGYDLTGGIDDDDDGDGLSNFQEFAFGLNPTSGASVNPITDFSELKSNGTFSFTRLEGSGLDYTVWISTDLQDWGTGPVGAIQEPGQADANGVQIVLVTLDSLPVGDKFFLRVKAD